MIDIDTLTAKTCIDGKWVIARPVKDSRIIERIKDAWQVLFAADDLIERACEDLHEDARDQISRADINELQGFLDIWAKKQSGTETYTCDPRYAIRIPWQQASNI